MLRGRCHLCLSCASPTADLRDASRTVRGRIPIRATGSARRCVGSWRACQAAAHRAWIAPAGQGTRRTTAWLEYTFFAICGRSDFLLMGLGWGCGGLKAALRFAPPPVRPSACLLYTSDAADDLLCVDL